MKGTFLRTFNHCNLVIPYKPPDCSSPPYGSEKTNLLTWQTKISGGEFTSVKKNKTKQKTGETKLGEKIGNTLPTPSKTFWKKQPNAERRKKQAPGKRPCREANLGSRILRKQEKPVKLAKPPVPSYPAISQEKISEWREGENVPSPRAPRCTTTSHH